MERKILSDLLEAFELKEKLENSLDFQIQLEVARICNCERCVRAKETFTLVRGKYEVLLLEYRRRLWEEVEQFLAGI